MLSNLSFTTTVSNLWNTAKSYVTTPKLNINQEQKNSVEQNHPSEETNCNKATRGRDTTLFSAAALLTTVGLGLWAQKREVEQNPRSEQSLKKNRAERFEYLPTFRH